MTRQLPDPDGFLERHLKLILGIDMCEHTKTDLAECLRIESALTTDQFSARRLATYSDEAEKLEAALAASLQGWQAVAAIGELIRTQDNRITSNPIFVVEQKRRVCGVEDDYAEGHLWFDPRACESYDEAEKAERDAEREHEGLSPIKWQKGGYVDTWEFVTACFTERGCKDYIACNGHNLREPRIFVHSGFRNAEWQLLREYLAGRTAPPPAELARDAARLDYLDSITEAYGFENEHLGNRWTIEGPFRCIRDAIDADSAAMGDSNRG